MRKRKKERNEKKKETKMRKDNTPTSSWAFYCFEADIDRNDKTR